MMNTSSKQNTLIKGLSSQLGQGTHMANGLWYIRDIYRDINVLEAEPSLNGNSLINIPRPQTHPLQKLQSFCALWKYPEKRPRASGATYFSCPIICRPDRLTITKSACKPISRSQPKLATPHKNCWKDAQLQCSQSSAHALSSQPAKLYKEAPTTT